MIVSARDRPDGRLTAARTVINVLGVLSGLDRVGSGHHAFHQEGE